MIIGYIEERNQYRSMPNVYKVCMYVCMCVCVLSYLYGICLFSNYNIYIAIFEKDQIQIEEIIVYGIGKLVENISAQYQIAVLLLLMDSFPKASRINGNLKTRFLYRLNKF